MTFNENWYSDNQCNDLAELVKKVKTLNGSVIEIGCWEGKSTHHIANEIYPEVMICNDHWLGNIDESLCIGTTHCSELIAKERDVYEVFIQNMNSLTQGNYKVIKEDCQAWLNEYNDPIKFCHIDASHDYKSVAETIQHVLKRIVKGGVICGDDFINASAMRTDLQGGVEQAVKDNLQGFSNKGNLWFWTAE